MTKQQLDHFFMVLSREFNATATIILTGAAAGTLWGSTRPSLDVDFAVHLAQPTDALWQRFDEAAQRTTALTGLPVNYAEDIDRWSQITLLDWRDHARLYRRFGRLRVTLLDPAYWTIGKLARYLAPDVGDLVAVLSRQRVPPARLAKLWGQALAASPKSLALRRFLQQVEHFLRTHGRAIWGRRFDPEAAIRQFHRAAGLDL